jgi:hypothetical protein
MRVSREIKNKPEKKMLAAFADTGGSLTARASTPSMMASSANRIIHPNILLSSLLHLRRALFGREHTLPCAIRVPTRISNNSSAVHAFTRTGLNFLPAKPLAEIATA